MRYVADHLIGKFGICARMAMDRLLEIHKEHPDIPIFKDDVGAQIARAFLLYCELMRRHQPLKMRPWVFLECLKAMADEEIERMDKKFKEQQQEQENAQPAEQSAEEKKP